MQRFDRQRLSETSDAVSRAFVQTCRIFVQRPALLQQGLATKYGAQTNSLFFLDGMPDTCSHRALVTD
jgi:hypothetical protein